MKKSLLSLLAIILIIEEWLWDALSALGHFLAYHFGFARFEQWLLQSSPYQALFAISIPILLVTPINITAFWLLANGLILQGIALEIVAKLLGTLFYCAFFYANQETVVNVSSSQSVFIPLCQPIVHFFVQLFKVLFESRTYALTKIVIVKSIGYDEFLTDIF